MAYFSVMERITTSRNTFPTICTIAIALWLTIRPEGATLPVLLSTLAAAIIAIYLIAELKNRHSLLRSGSRMIASLLALQLAMTTDMHLSLTAVVLTILGVMHYFALISCYQTESPNIVFMGMLFFSLTTLIQPTLLLFSPVLFVCLYILRALTARCFVAAIIGLLIPYWLWTGWMLVFGDFNELFTQMQGFIPSLKLPDYRGIPSQHWATLLVSALLFISGTINFYRTNYLDKTQTRINHITVIVHGVALLVFLILRIDLFIDIFPLFMIDAAIVGGHYLALTHNRTSFIITIGLALAWAAITTMQLWIA